MTYIGVGSNLRPERNIRRALELLIARGLRPEALSTHYRSEPVRRKENPSYINGVWRLKSALPYGGLKEVLKAVEEETGRRRREDPYASREIDLDILLHPGLPEAHEDITARNFVYLPLLELDETIALPGRGPLTELVDRGDLRGLRPLEDFTKELRSIAHG